MDAFGGNWSGVNLWESDPFSVIYHNLKDFTPNFVGNLPPIWKVVDSQCCGGVTTSFWGVICHKF